MENERDRFILTLEWPISKSRDSRQKEPCTFTHCGVIALNHPSLFIHVCFEIGSDRWRLRKAGIESGEKSTFISSFLFPRSAYTFVPISQDGKARSFMHDTALGNREMKGISPLSIERARESESFC